MAKLHTIDQKVEAQMKRHPNKSLVLIAEKYDISLREVQRIAKKNEIEKEEIISMFKKAYDNRTSTIAKSLNITEHKVSRIINTYLNELK